MRSDTLLSLGEFIDWVGGNPWAFAQIDLGGDRLRDSNMVSYEYPWQLPYENDTSRAGSNTRQAVAHAIRRAETQFLKWTKFYPVPVYLTNEEHPIRRSAHSTRRTGYQPKYGFVQNFGVRTMTEIDAADITLTRGAPDDTFTISVNVPDDTEADSLHVFLTEADAGYSGTPLLKHEIRPLANVTIDSSGGDGNWTAEIEAAAYLFVKPEHYAEKEPEVLEHALDTYVDEVAVWVETIDTTAPGLAVLKRGRCANPPCNDDVTELICWERIPDWQGYYSPSRVKLVDGAFQRTTYSYTPMAMQFNYLAGYLRENRLMAGIVKDIVCMLTIALMQGEDIPENEDNKTSVINSVCETYMTATFWEYRSIQKWEKQTENMLASGGKSGSGYDIALTDAAKERLNGLEPRRGFIKALQELDEAGWYTRHGASVHF
jgi:hypothetical protein